LSCPVYNSLMDLQAKCNEIDSRLQEEKIFSNRFGATTESKGSSRKIEKKYEPMQIDNIEKKKFTKLDQKEKDRRKTNKLCPYCGVVGCPGFPKAEGCTTKKNLKENVYKKNVSSSVKEINSLNSETSH